ncbi:hypothetical protein N4241_10550 [Riemerella anatipestifer]|uniref:hypothetical protein n=1 Tax=Riemerella anatipestifer TaxID=34085 RepID=UPI0021D5B5B8|nr:hypothetical protein [Riemerella anatipestifer]MCU7571544.1 hypothetical protein [Riemerella anatipestifer]
MKHLPQPFDQEDIRKDPKAVVIGLLIGFLLLFSGVVAVLYQHKEKKSENCDEKIQRLYAEMLESRNRRIELYEEMIFYKRKSEAFQRRDSLMKLKTQPLIEKIYNHEN